MFRILEALSPQQYVFAFGFLCGYALALGKFLGPRGRLAAILTTLMSAAGFCALSDPWVDAVMLVAVALVGMGLFTGGVWVFWSVMAPSEHRTTETEAAGCRAKTLQPKASGLLRRLRARLRLTSELP